MDLFDDDDSGFLQHFGLFCNKQQKLMKVPTKKREVFFLSKKEEIILKTGNCALCFWMM